MINKRLWTVLFPLILLALAACQPTTSAGPAEQEPAPVLATAIPTDLFAATPALKPINPSPSAIPTEEPTMTEDPTDLPPTAMIEETAEPHDAQQSGQQTADPTLQPSIHNWVLIAMEDLAQRLSISTSEIELVSYEDKVWPDAGLGCPQPGMMYTQVLQDGYLIVLGAGDETYNYHGGGSRNSEPFLCEEPGPQIVITKNAPLDLKTTPTKSVPPPRD